MKILQINNVYGEKSTGKITQAIHRALRQAGHESVVVYGRGCGKEEAGVLRLCPDWYGKANSLISRFTGLRYGGCLLSTWRLQRIIRREKPDVVHLQCINGNFVNIYRLIGWLKRNRIKTVVSLHAEFMYTANCGHAFSCDQWKQGCKRCPDKKKMTKSLLFDRTGTSWKKMKAAFEGFEQDCVICPVSPWTEARARQSAILKNFSFRTVYNGLDTDVFCSGQGKCVQERTVLHVTAQFSGEKDHPKGGWYLLELAKRMPDVRFQVVGPAEQFAQCPDNLQLLGVISDQKQLAELYRRAQVSVVVSRRETFSMPCAESLCCGTPVTGFRAGAPEQISLPEFGSFVEFGDLDALEAQLRFWLNRNDTDRNAVAQAAKKRYSAETMVNDFMNVYGRVLWN